MKRWSGTEWVEVASINQIIGVNSLIPQPTHRLDLNFFPFNSPYKTLNVNQNISEPTYNYEII